jgi:two-component system chemotaxis response regulator CheB
LERVFSGLNKNVPASYLVVQHLPDGFSGSLARRLDTVGAIDVREAEEGMPLEPGTALLAPHGAHMVVRVTSGEPRVAFDDSPPCHGVRPAADPLFESVAEVFGARAVGVVLSGMGSDGARGLAAIRSAGGDTIIQNEATSVVWGMPGAAQRVGAVRHIVPVGLVAAEIRRNIKARS